MHLSWIEQTKVFKSPVRVVAGFLLRSRETQAAQKRRLKERCHQLQQEQKQQAKLIEEQRQEIARLKQKVRALDIERAEASPKSFALPADPPVGNHGYGARMVSLAVTLAQAVGLRGSERVMKIFLIGFPSSRACRTSRRSVSG